MRRVRWQIRGAIQVSPRCSAFAWDTLKQGQRDFIIESQLMQDPDPNATNGSTDPNNPIPPSVARYQTHLTLVDDQKILLPNETVKIMYDSFNDRDQRGRRAIQRPGLATRPSRRSRPARRQGLVLVSDEEGREQLGLARAPFMNPYERIVVYPDHEHGRAAQSIADPKAAIPTDLDPTKANLSTAYTYKGATVHHRREEENTPVNVANAISQMNKGLMPGGVTSAAFAER